MIVAKPPAGCLALRTKSLQIVVTKQLWAGASEFLFVSAVVDVVATHIRGPPRFNSIPAAPQQTTINGGL